MIRKIKLKNPQNSDKILKTQYGKTVNELSLSRLVKNLTKNNNSNNKKIIRSNFLQNLKLNSSIF